MDKHSPQNTTIEIQKLFEKEHFKKILNHNLSSLLLWKKTYPNHEDWIRKVVRRFIDDSYNRVAFGGFYHDPKKKRKFLCCSVILKKNPYTPFLEIKNLIVFDYPKDTEDNIDHYKEFYQRQLISHIKKFAEQRGYPRLAVELSTQNKETKDLIKIFLEEDFVIAGRQINRYGKSDEIYFLTTEINEVYGYDPYDNFSASEWILSKYLKSNKLETVKDGVVISGAGKKIPKDSFVFYSGERYENEPKSKFNSKNCIVIIEEYFRHINNIDRIEQIERKDNELSNFFVFDFSTQSILSNQVINSNFKIFNREELDDLMYESQERFDRGNKNKLYRFSYEKMGGLLLVSNPLRFLPDTKNLKFDEIPNKVSEKLNKIFNENKSAIYIKLGSLGKSLQEDMPLVFAYYPKDSNRAKLEVWGVASLSSSGIPIDLEELREHNHYFNSTQKESSENELAYENTDGDLLFDYLMNLADTKSGNEIIEDSILWNKEDFDKHNAYNATKRVVCFQIKDFKNLSQNGQTIDVQEILDDTEYLDDIENVFDFYLSKSEIEKLDFKLKGEEAMPAEPKLQFPLKILFVTASPIDTVRLQTDREYREISDQMLRGKHRDNFQFLPPQLSVTITNLITAMNENPNIIHFSGHSNDDGIVITTNNNEPQLLSTETIKRIFKNKEKINRLILLNSCYSAEQAKSLSEFGYVIGNKVKISDESSISFAKGLYNGLGAGKEFPDAVNDGLIVLETEHPNSKNTIEVWKDGKLIEI